MNDEEEFYAWLDGELEERDAARVAARVADDPRLAALAAKHQTMGEALRNSFAPVMGADIPPPRMTADVVELAERRTKPTGFGLPQWAAMAATLVVGLLAGQFLDFQSEAPLDSRGGTLVAAAALDSALGQKLASAGSDGPVQIGLTFRSVDGKICRSFAQAGSSGLACRDGGRWRIDAIFAAPPAAGGDYRMAAAGDPRLAELIDSRIAGDPFDAAAEKAARDGGWR